jgi:methyl-accepting chemotaxis protein
MLGAIVGLLEETRRQRDVLTNAAEHLFSDMRVVSAGDLRINASVSNDPIGMLANAFNFTVGRFRRFVLRTQIATEQIDVISRQELERSAAFAQTLNSHKVDVSDPPQGVGAVALARNRVEGKTVSAHLEPLDKGSNDLVAQVRHVRERQLQLSGEGVIRQTRSMLVLAEQISLALSRLSKAMAAERETLSRTTMGDTSRVYIQELHTLEKMLQRMVAELENLQKNTVDSSRALDADLTKVAAAVHTLRPKHTEGAATISIADESIQDVLRQGNEFTNEIATLARQLALLANEMRSGIVAFQLDTANSGGTAVSSPNNRLAANSEPAERTAPLQRRSFPVKVE